MHVTILSDDHFSAVGLVQCLAEGGIPHSVVRTQSDLPNSYLDVQSACTVIDAGLDHPRVWVDAIRWATRNQSPSLLVLRHLQPEWLQSAVEFGVTGIVSRGQAQEYLPAAVRALAAGQVWIPVCVTADLPAGVPELSAREREALSLYCDGYKIETIAIRMHVSQSTISTYLARIRAKYVAVGRPARTRLALREEAAKDGFVQSW